MPSVPQQINPPGRNFPGRNPPGRNPPGNVDRSYYREDQTPRQLGRGSVDDKCHEDEEYDEEGDEGVSVLDSLRHLGQFVRRRPLIAMSYASIPLLAFLSGILVTLYRIEPVDKEEIIRGLQGDLVANITRNATAQIRKKLQMDLQEIQLKCKLSRSQTEAFQERNLQEMNAMETRLQDNVTSSTETLKQNMKETLKDWKADLGTSLEEKMQTLLQEKTEDLVRDFEQGIQQAETSMAGKMEDVSRRLSRTFQEDLKEAKSGMGDVQSQTGRLKELVDKIDIQQSVTEQLMELRGFMKIDAFGPLLLGLAVGEALIVLCVCTLFRRGVTGRAGSREQQGQGPRQEGDSSETRERRREPRPPRLIDTSNRVVLGLRFRDADEQLATTLSAPLVEACTNQKPRLRTFFVNSMEDIQDIPACRAALVFVAPDEREMIIEDERHHIGQGLRRHAVQRLLDSGVEVFIIIFNDKKSVTLPAGHLYNSKLGQVDEHAQLMMLKRRRRVFSIRDKFLDHQNAALLKELNTIFT
ncbi:hypothetical protein ACOMHN_007406 [Nucella lapillus]